MKNKLEYSSKEELQLFKENIDGWVKQIRSKFDEISDIPEAVLDNSSNIQHNYELINELRDGMEQLNKEIKLLRLLQLSQLKKKLIEQQN